MFVLIKAKKSFWYLCPRYKILECGLELESNVENKNPFIIYQIYWVEKK